MSGHHPIVEEDLDTIVSSVNDWQIFKNKTILISGANGFLPAFMIFAFLKADEKFGLNLKVIGLARNREKAEKKFKTHLSKKFSLIIQDVIEPTNLKEKIDFVIHAASQASPRYYGVDPVGTLNANVLGTHNLLTLAKEHRSEGFLFFSTSEVYGHVEEKFIPTREDQYGYIDITNVRSCYAESKRMGETMCVSWWKQHQVPVKIIRPFHTYGPGMQYDDGRVYADFVFNVLSNKDIVLRSDGSARRAFCYLTDAIIGFFTVLAEGKVGEAYNVGNPGAEISIYELATLLTELFPGKKLKVRREQVESPDYLKSTVSRNSPDIGKLQDLGWKPRFNIREGFTRTINSYL